MQTEIKIDFFVTPFTGVDGVRRTITLGLGSNHTLWIEWEELGLRRQLARDLARNQPGPAFLIDVENDRLFVNADAVTGIIDSPELRAAWVKNNEVILKNYRCICPQHESAKYN